MNRKEPAEEHRMTFLEHLEELRKRLIRSTLAIVVGIGICWFFREQIRHFLEAPLYDVWSTIPGLPPPEPLRFTSLLEPFMVYLKLASIAGLFLASPVVFYHLWKFVAPGLWPRERRYVMPFVIISSILFVAGSLGAYKFVFPTGFGFFLEFAAGGRSESSVAEVVVSAEKSKSVQPTPQDAARDTDRAARSDRPTDTEGETDGDTASDSVPGTDSGSADEVDTADDSDTGTGAIADSDTDSIGVTARTPSAPPTNDAAPPPKTPVRHPPKEPPPMSSAERMYNWVLQQLMDKECGALFATATPEQNVQLYYQFDKSRCGDAPIITAVKRNQSPVSVNFEISDAAGASFARFAGSDTPGAGKWRYEVFSLQTPQSQGKLAPMLMVSDYLDFAVKLLLAFGLIFELPVLLVFLSLAGLVTWRQLLAFSRWFIVLAFVVAAILTPPDVLTQFMLAVPLIALYFISVLVIFIIQRNQTPAG